MNQDEWGSMLFKVMMGLVVGLLTIVVIWGAAIRINEDVFVCSNVCSAVHNHTMTYEEAIGNCTWMSIKQFDRCYKEGVLEVVGLN